MKISYAVALILICTRSFGEEVDAKRHVDGQMQLKKEELALSLMNNSGEIVKRTVRDLHDKRVITVLSENDRIQIILDPSTLNFFEVSRFRLRERTAFTALDSDRASVVAAQYAEKLLGPEWTKTTPSSPITWIATKSGVMPICGQPVGAGG